MSRDDAWGEPHHELPELPQLPELAQLQAGLRVVRIPMRVRFRGLAHREVALLEGPSGWGEFGPFPEYPPAEAARWLAAAIEAGYAAWPPPVRERVPVNATVPAVPAAQVPAVLASKLTSTRSTRRGSVATVASCVTSIVTSRTPAARWPRVRRWCGPMRRPRRARGPRHRPVR